MVEIKLPYDKKTIVAKIPDENFAGLLESKAENFHNPLSEEETVERSMDNPIGSPSLEELAKGKKDIVLISSDHTRPVPSHIITPIILRRIRSVNPDARVRILVATGFHRPSTREELINKYGQEIVDNEEIVNQSFQVSHHTKLSWRTTQVTSSTLIKHVLVTLTTTQSTKICFMLLVLQNWPSSSMLYWTAKNTSSDLSLGTWLKPTKLVVILLQTWHTYLRSKATLLFQQTVVSHLTKTSTKPLKG